MATALRGKGRAPLVLVIPWGHDPVPEASVRRCEVLNHVGRVLAYRVLQAVVACCVLMKVGDWFRRRFPANIPLQASCLQRSSLTGWVL